MLYLPFGEKQLMEKLQSFLQAKVDGKLKLISRPLAMNCEGRVPMPFGSGRVCLQVWCMDLSYETLCLLSCCQVRPMALKNHPIITCDKSSNYLKDQTINPQEDKWIQEDDWCMLEIGDACCEEARTKDAEQTLLSQAHGCPLIWVTWQTWEKVNHLYMKTTWKWWWIMPMLVIMTKPSEMENSEWFYVILSLGPQVSEFWSELFSLV